MKTKAQLAKGLRRQSTKSERHLWRFLRSRQLHGLKFRRQQPIGDYIVDFVCFETKTVVEVDGGQHGVTVGRQEDQTRDAELSRQGFVVLRFWNDEVLRNTGGVLEIIRRRCAERICHPPRTPPIQGGGG